MISLIIDRFIITSNNILIDYAVESYVNIMPPSGLASLLNTPQFFVFICVLPIIYLSVKYAQSKDRHHKILHHFAMSIGLLFSAYFISTFIGGGMSHRLLPLLSIYASVCTAYLLWYVTSKLLKEKKYINKIFVGISIFIVVFSMVNLPYEEIATDNPIYVKGTTIQGSISNSDLIGLKTFSKYYPEEVYIYCDNFNIMRCLSYTTFLSEYNSQHVIPDVREKGLIPSWDSIYNQKGTHLILRDDLYSTPAFNRVYHDIAYYTDQYIQLNTNYIDNLIDEGNVVYTCGGLSSLLIGG